jgi:hypothetical protein
MDSPADFLSFDHSAASVCQRTESFEVWVGGGGGGWGAIFLEKVVSGPLTSNSACVVFLWMKNDIGEVPAPVGRL